MEEITLELFWIFVIIILFMFSITIICGFILIHYNYRLNKLERKLKTQK